MKLFSRKTNKPPVRSNYNPLSYVTSFSKAITVIWLFLFAETILFSQIATVFSLGDALSIQYINDTIAKIGTIVAAFYFSSKTVENVAQGYEQYKLEQMNNAIKDASDDEVSPAD